VTQYIKSLGKKIDGLYRIRFLKQIYLFNLRHYDVQFLMFKKYGKVNLNTFELLDPKFNYWDETDCKEFNRRKELNRFYFEDNCITLLNHLESFDDLEAVVKNQKMGCGTFITVDYLYMWGSYLAYYAYKHCNVKDIARLCSLSSNIIDGKQTWDTFREFSIDTNDDLLFDESLLVMQEFIEEYGKGDKVMV